MNTAIANAAEVSQRVLSLIDSVHGPEQVEPSHIERVTGFKVAVSATNPQQYGFSGELTADWGYSLVSLTELDGSRPHRLMFSFEDGSADGNADMAPICDMDFADYDKALTGAGFASEAARGHHGEIEYWQYHRGDVSVLVHTRGESDARADRACVSMIVINA